MNKNKKTVRMLTMESKVRTFSIKIYDEQLPMGWKMTCDAIRGIDKKEIQVLAICHDADYNSDDIWLPSIEKPHYHIIGRMLNHKSKRLKNILDALIIEFRKELDENLWKNHGVETVKKFSSMGMYLTHETEEAILDGKTLYPLENIVSNLTIDEIIEIRQGYVRVGQNGGYKKTFTEMAELDVLARNLGYELGNFNKWRYDLDFGTRCNAKLKVIEQSYFDGVAKRVEDNKEVIRLCIFIQGSKNTGKTYSAIHALKGKQVLSIGGGGTGKLDDLMPYTDAIVIDDDTCPNLLNMTDNYMCKAYKRQSNNPYWCGDTFVVTSNLSFREWLEKSNLKTTNRDGSDNEHYRAMLSRFYICSIEKCGEHNYLACSSPSTRGAYDEQQTRKSMFIKFRDSFNAIMSEYIPDTKKISYDDILDFFPIQEGEINPFEISEDIENIYIQKHNTGFKTSAGILDFYKTSKPLLYKKADENVRKKLAKMGIHNVIKNTMYDDAMLYECIQLDMKEQYKENKKKQKSAVKSR